jgi:enoyl-CoA hydratase
MSGSGHPPLCVWRMAIYDLAMSENPLIRYELRDGVAIISLDDGKANVFSPAMSAAIDGALDRAEQEAKAVVFAGRPGRFSGGFDLGIMKEGGPAAAEAMVKAGAELVLRIYGFPRPTLVAVTGHALAMGAMFILGCDRRIGAAGNFKIGLNESKIGMTLPVFATELCRERLDPRHLTDAAILAEIYDPEKACIVGYLDRTVPAEEVVAATIAEATRLAAEITLRGMNGTKQRIRAAAMARIRETLDHDVKDLMS